MDGATESDIKWVAVSAEKRKRSENSGEGDRKIDAEDSWREQKTTGDMSKVCHDERADEVKDINEKVGRRPVSTEYDIVDIHLNCGLVKQFTLWTVSVGSGTISATDDCNAENVDGLKPKESDPLTISLLILRSDLTKTMLRVPMPFTKFLCAKSFDNDNSSKHFKAWLHERRIL